MPMKQEPISPISDGSIDEIEQEPGTSSKKAPVKSRWNDENKEWQKITAADFEEIRELSDTEDEFDPTTLKVEESNLRVRISKHANGFYTKGPDGNIAGTIFLSVVQKKFEERVLNHIAMSKEEQPKSEPPPPPAFHSNCSCGHGKAEVYSSDSESSSSDSSSDSGSSSEGEVKDDDRPTKSSTSKKKKPTNVTKKKAKKEPSESEHVVIARQEITRKRTHPAGMHPDLAFNEPGQSNDGPHCKCSWAAKKTGVRHNKFVGEKPIELCNLTTNNAEKLHHYVLKIEPNPGKFSRSQTQICIDGCTYTFEGFSVFFHQPLPEVFPQSPLSQWSNEYKVKFVKDKMPENFTIKDLELFHTYLFQDIMEFYDIDRMPNMPENLPSCFLYHSMPRFTRLVGENLKELLPMSTVLEHFTNTYRLFLTECGAKTLSKNPDQLKELSRTSRGQIFVHPQKKPTAIRVDLIDSHDEDSPINDFPFPVFTHFGIRPSAYAYSGKPEYQRALKSFIKLRHLLSMKGRLTTQDRDELAEKEREVNKLKSECKTKRDLVVTLSARGFYQTGFYPDVIQHAAMLVLAVSHIRFHWSLKVFEEESIRYKFKNRSLLELALTHPSYRTNYGTNPDHAKNTLNNIGIRPVKGFQIKKEQNFNNMRKRGINVLMEIMSRFGSKKVENSPISHNERLEFLGDAVIEFITTVHLFFLFLDLEEGGLATYRSALVQNKNLAVLAKKIGLDNYMLYAHGPDLCHESDLRHAMANAFEALMAAVYLDSNVNECDKIFSRALYGDDPQSFEKWTTLPEHPLKCKNPYGDRHLIDRVPCLKLLSEFEDSIGVKFLHIRLLAKAFTRRNVGYNNLTMGHNQRLEFLGDTVLQLITTDYLYKHFPYHHEGHLSLLRTCLVSNKTQAVICDDLVMQKYLVIPKVMQKQSIIGNLRQKDKADLVEAFLGALYVDRGLDYCRTFCRVCFFPRLKYFILTQRWNDPKSQLQQCCLTLRQLDSGEPDIPEYKTIGVEGPTNTRIYRVAVYFRYKRLAEGVGHSVQMAEMQAAENALIERADLFPAFNISDSYLGASVNEGSKPRPTRRRKVQRGVGESPFKKRARLASHAFGRESRDRPGSSKDTGYNRAKVIEHLRNMKNKK